MLVDRDGLLWVGSREGLFRYDGYQASAFLPDPERPGQISDIDVRAIGLPGDAESPLGDALDDLAERAEAAVMKLKGAALEDEMVIEQAVSRALKKASQQIWDRRPIVETIILRL